MLSSVRVTCQLMFAIAVLCVLTRTCTHMYVRFVHADPGEALRRRGRRGPRKAAAVRQVTEFVRTRPCQARPGLWPEDVAVLQAACQALRSCAGGGRVDAAPGPSRRGTAPSMPVRTAAHSGPPTRECVGEWGGRPPVRMHRNQSRIRPRSHPARGPRSAHGRDGAPASREEADVTWLCAASAGRPLARSIVPALRRPHVAGRPRTGPGLSQHPRRCPSCLV